VPPVHALGAVAATDFARKVAAIDRRVWTGFPINTHLAPSSPIRPSKSLFDMAINSDHRAHRFDAQFSEPFDGLMSITKYGQS